MIHRIKNKIVREYNKARKKLYLNENEKKILALKDKHKGERCFILGMGPSLKVEDIEKLKDEVTFACNKIYLTYNQTEWRPTYFSVCDHLVAINNKKELNDIKEFKIHSMAMKQYGVPADIWIDELGCKFNNDKFNCFSENLIDGWYGGGTIIYRQIQLAYYMGFRKIYLLGIDFSFDISKSIRKDKIIGEVLENNDEKNHFHKDYRKPGETWTMPKLELQEAAFLTARKKLSQKNCIIYNLSRNTKLEVLKRKKLDDIL